MSPLIPAIIGGSMVKLLAMILEMSGALPKGSPTLTLLALIGDGAFFFLPLMVAASAAVKFKTICRWLSPSPGCWCIPGLSN